jgi:hypothetical protein
MRRRTVTILNTAHSVAITALVTSKEAKISVPILGIPATITTVRVPVIYFATYHKIRVIPMMRMPPAIILPNGPTIILKHVALKAAPSTL